MPVNIGPKIGIDGEKEFRQNLNSISQQLKTLGTEMKAVTSAFDANDKSQENLANQSQVLTEQLSLQEKRIEEIQKALDHARANYDENSNEVQRWQQAMNNAVTELNKTRSQLSKVQSEMDGASDSTQDMSDALNDVDGAAEKASSGISSMTVAMGNLISSGIQAAASAVADLVSSLWNLDESTEEYRRAQGRLNTAFEAAGYGADTAQQAYKAFYGILGDTDTATEASQLLAQLAESEEDVATWAEIAAGVSGTFGDSLPIEGLIEAANETAKVGEVTGTLADALNWVGISEDEFNAKLAAAGSESERNRLIMETLSNQYDQAAQAFYRNNEALVESRNTQAEMSETLSSVGEAVANMKNQLSQELLPVLQEIISGIDWNQLGETIAGFVSTLVDNGPTIISVISGIAAGFAAWKVVTTIQGMVTAIQAFAAANQGASIAQLALNAAMKANPIAIIITAIAGLVTVIGTLWATNEDFRNAVIEIWENIKQAFVDAWENIKAAWDAAKPYFEAIWEGIKSVFSVVADVLTGFFKAAWSGITAVWDVVIGYFENIWNTIKGIFAVVEAVLRGDFQAAWEAIKNVFAGWKDFFTGLWDDITNVFSNVWEVFSNIGKNIVDGIKNGISNAWNGLKNWFSGLLDNLFSSVEDNEEIHSPSKKYEKIGRYDAMGIGVGFSNEMRNVQRQIDRSMAGLVAPTMTYGVTAATSAPVYSGGDTIGASVGAAVRAALDGAAVYLNGRKVGNLIIQQQNQTAIARGQSQVYI